MSLYSVKQYTINNDFNMHYWTSQNMLLNENNYAILKTN